MTAPRTTPFVEEIAATLTVDCGLEDVRSNRYHGYDFTISGVTLRLAQADQEGGLEVSVLAASGVCLQETTFSRGVSISAIVAFLGSLGDFIHAVAV